MMNTFSGTAGVSGDHAPDRQRVREFVIFRLGNEEYAIDILKVQEIRGYESVTGIANMPAFIKGVINLRGVIVPIVDMRIKFGQGEPTYDDLTVVIVLNIGGRIVSMVVDGVSDVVSIAENAIHPPPELGLFEARFLTGMATFDSRLLILVDIEGLMTSAEMALVEHAA